MIRSARWFVPLFGLLATLNFTVARAADICPIVEVETEFVIGAYSGGKWLPSDKAAKAIKPGTNYKVYSLTGEVGTSKGGKPVANQDVCPDVFTVELTPKPDKGAIAVAVPWNPMPRTPKIADPTQPVYIQAAHDFLVSHGIKDPKVKITKIVRIDLDGDGEDEVLLSATNYFTKDGVPSDSPAGSYSFVLLRRVVNGKVITQMVAGEFHPSGKKFNAPMKFEIEGVLDLDGDGKMEVLIQGNYYEGGGTTIYRCTPSKVEEVLSVACGA